MNAKKIESWLQETLAYRWPGTISHLDWAIYSELVLAVKQSYLKNPIISYIYRRRSAIWFYN